MNTKWYPKETENANLRVEKNFRAVRLVAVDIHTNSGTRTSGTTKSENDPGAIIERNYNTLRMHKHIIDQ